VLGFVALAIFRSVGDVLVAGAVSFMLVTVFGAAIAAHIQG
jgi:hypothetical protein